MTKTIAVNPKYAKNAVIIRGVFRGKLSPYDVPERAEATYDASEKRFRIEFEYLTPNEPRVMKHVSENGITLWIGRHSSKLYAVEIEDITADAIPDVRIEIVEAIDGLTKALSPNEPKNFVPIMNLNLTRDFLREEVDIFAVPA